jgi:hypothetical protein
MRMPWDAIKYVSSVTTLIAFLAALVAWSLGRWAANQRRMIADATDKRRADLVARSLEKFNVDISRLTREQQYRLALKQLEARSKRFYVITAATVILTVIALAVYLTVGQTRRFDVRAQGQGPQGTHLVITDRNEGSGIVGGGGGNVFRDACDSTEALVGLAGREGEFREGEGKDARVFRIAGICGELRLANRQTETGVYQIEISTRHQTAARGSPGEGKEFRAECPEHAFVRGVDLRGAPFYLDGQDAGTYLTSVKATCARAQAQPDGRIELLSADTLPTIGVLLSHGSGVEFHCPGNGFASGLVGRTGDWVDALGISCRVLSIGR